MRTFINVTMAMPTARMLAALTVIGRLLGSVGGWFAARGPSQQDGI